MGNDAKAQETAGLNAISFIPTPSCIHQTGLLLRNPGPLLFPGWAWASQGISGIFVQCSLSLSSSPHAFFQLVSAVRVKLSWVLGLILSQTGFLVEANQGAEPARIWVFGRSSLLLHQGLASRVAQCLSPPLPQGTWLLVGLGAGHSLLAHSASRQLVLMVRVGWGLYWTLSWRELNYYGIVKFLWKIVD